MKIRCRSIIALWGRRRVLSADGEVSLLLADAHTAISHLLNDMSFCGVMNTHRSQRSLRKLPDNAQIKILAGKNPARTTDILKGGDMIDKMLEKWEVLSRNTDTAFTDDIRNLLLSARPEWEAMVKRVEALEEGRIHAWDRMDSIVSVSERIEEEFRGRFSDIYGRMEKLEQAYRQTISLAYQDTQKPVTEEKPSECEHHYELVFGHHTDMLTYRCCKCMSQMTIHNCKPTQQSDTITIPRAVAEEIVHLKRLGCTGEVMINAIRRLRKEMK